ncbi:nucleotidyltransferase domain-containing protein [Parabacteroides sp. ZJ-118]|uniref:nucleotidyltransferase domain-containing protein n=1 Tax=Parabacteroides sp. ZJ-118 TaxID=2709398 RepID=UPI0013EBC3BE|nr:nucleotidyltransferase domain-containing protein [Parabacteroides sp. ZJ-118]
MTSKQSIIIHELTRLARLMFSNGSGTVYLYGSQARGNSSLRSDWDILVITDDSIATDDDFLRFAFPYAELGWRFGEQITPVHFTRSEWNAEQGSAFYSNVLAEAIKLCQ